MQGAKGKELGAGGREHRAGDRRKENEEWRPEKGKRRMETGEWRPEKGNRKDRRLEKGERKPEKGICNTDHGIGKMNVKKVICLTVKFTT